ncbi:hypothetical protein Tco_0271762 [Tanacetum coccineum]
MSLEAHQEKGEGEGDDADMDRAYKLSLGPAFLPQEEELRTSLSLLSVIRLLLIRQLDLLLQPEDDTSEKVIHESSSTSDSERTESETEAVAPKGDKDQGEVDSSTVTSGVSIPVSNPEKAHEALAGPDPEPMQEDQNWIKL